MRRGIPVVDADCHQMESRKTWKRYLEPRFRDEAPRRVKRGDSFVWGIEGETLRREDGRFPASSPEFRAAQERTRERYARASEHGFSAESRLLDMDDTGVDVSILNPTIGGQLLGREFKDVELLAACCRAYNDWSSDYCARDPDRLRWVAMLPLQAPALAAAEVRRARDLGAVAFYARPNPVAGRQLHSRDYDPVWAEVERADRPLVVHDTGSPRLPSYGDRMESHTTGHMLAHSFEAMATLMGLIWFGVFERFPALDVVHLECDAGWLPWWLQRMEDHWEFPGNGEHPYLTRRPTEYFRSNVYVSARGDERTLPGVVDQVGDDRLVFHTDYPHADGTWPFGLERLEAQPIPDESRRRILWDNPARAFRLPEWTPREGVAAALRDRALRAGAGLRRARRRL